MGLEVVQLPVSLLLIGSSSNTCDGRRAHQAPTSAGIRVRGVRRFLGHKI